MDEKLIDFHLAQYSLCHHQIRNLQNYMHRMIVKHLDWKWNGLFKGIKDEKIREAYFVHFFLKDKLPNRGENVEELMKMVR